MKIKLVPRGTPEHLAALVEALRKSPLVVAIEASELSKRAAHHATGQARLWITLRDDIQVKPLAQRIRPPRRKGKQPGRKAGYVYLLAGPNDTYKIGYTVNPKNRHKTFNVKLPFPIKEFDHLIQTDDMIALEKALHQRFANRRVAGEWFALTEDDLTHIKSL